MQAELESASRQNGAAASGFNIVAVEIVSTTQQHAAFATAVQSSSDVRKNLNQWVPLGP